MNETNEILGRTILLLAATETEEKDKLSLTVNYNGSGTEIHNALQMLLDELKSVLETVNTTKG